MAYTTINKSSDYFNTKLYTGDNTNDRQISLDWSPDLTWIKARNVAYGHEWYDRVRGIGKDLSSSTTSAEGTNRHGWTNSGCTTDSFTVDRGSNETLNESGRPMVAWNWLANGTGSANTAGSINSTVSANTTAGFSIVSWTGNNSGSATVGHGLGAVPNVVIIKKRDGTTNWGFKHSSFASGAMAVLNTTDAPSNRNGSTNGGIGDLTSSTTFGFIGGGAGTPSENNGSMIAYCFAEKQGFSKFGSYTGNGNTSGTFCYTGMKPSFIIVKRTDATSNWRMWDNKRNTFNVVNKALLPNDSSAEQENSNQSIDFLSNGFKLRAGYADTNASGGTYIYMAFAEAPLVGTNNVPTTAR